MRVAIVHDWLVTFAGAERVLEQILNLYPDADLYAVVDFLKPKDRAILAGRSVRTSFIQKLPFARKAYRSYLPLMPLAIEQLDVSSYDLVISSSHAVAKGVLTGPDQLHISYVYSPIRYAWDLQHQYLRESGLISGPKAWLARWLLHKIRIWDYRTACGVDHFMACSNFIARRINKTYGRDAHVVYPPIDVDTFTMREQKDDFYLTASRMVPYKRIDLIVEAFSTTPERKLVVIGDGPDYEKIRQKAGSNVVLMGYQPTTVLVDMMRRARAFVFAAEEDFGIAPIEAQACGTPVIAYGKGGVLETVRGAGDEAQTGIFFREQTVSSLLAAVEAFEQRADLISASSCRENALRFTNTRFRNEFKAYVDSKWSDSKLMAHPAPLGINFAPLQP